MKPVASGAAATTTTSQPLRLVWHRRDLRLHDNPLYQNIADNNESVLSLYVFDKRNFQPRRTSSCCACKEWTTVDTGPYQAKLLRDAVIELRNNLERIGGTLLVRHGDPVHIVPSIARQLQATSIYWNEVPGTYERETSLAIQQQILSDNDEGIKIHTNCTYTLYHPNDLPPADNPNLWNQLAHPKQQKKSKRKLSAGQRGQLTAVPTNNLPKNITPSSHQQQQQLVDVSPERFRDMCPVMGDFRRAVRSFATIRDPIPPPHQLSLPPPSTQTTNPGDIPDLNDLYATLLQSDGGHATSSILGLESHVIQEIIRNARSNYKERGGESIALDRLQHFVTNAADTAERNLADVGADGSSKFSAHLALGTLSPRAVVHAVMTRENDNDDGCHWLVSHMEMRDFFQYSAFASDRSLFQATPLLSSTGHKKKKNKTVIEQQPPWHSPADRKEAWERWALGKTGLPLVDAAMVELTATGYCSNRVRQNAASVLAKDLLIDWRAGAEWFQFLLADHCVAANWGNWRYFSGVGSDPKNRHFRTVSQAARYDPTGDYVTKWLSSRLDPSLDIEAKLRPWDFVDTWTEPIVDVKTQLTWQDLQKLNDTGQLGGP